MAHTEFHPPEHRDDHDNIEVKIFDTVSVRMNRTVPVLGVTVDNYHKTIGITGISGRRQIDVDIARDMIRALESAIEFIEEEL